MKKKTAIIGGFLLFSLTSVVGIAYWVYSQALAFQANIQQLSDQHSLASQGLEFAHIRVGIGDLDQGSNFPQAQGKLRLSARNLCTDTLLDMGTLEYRMSQWPWFGNTGELQWFAPDAKPEDDPLLSVAVKAGDQHTVFELQESPWLGTIALKPVFSVQSGDQGIQIRASVQTLKLPAVTGDPSDFLARNLQLAFNIPAANLVDTRLEMKADQIGFETENIQQLDLNIVGELEEGEKVRWVAEVSTGALMVKSLLVDGTLGKHTLTVGDASALQFLIKSAIQSCGGYATAASHEFNVRAALSKLVTAGLKIDSQTELQLLGQTVKWVLNSEFSPQNDSSSGFLDLGRSLQLKTEFSMPFDKMGERQQDMFIRSGFFKEDEVRKPYTKVNKTNAMNTLANLRSASKGTPAYITGRVVGDLLLDTEQALYLKDFTFAANTQKVPRIAFDGLRDVTVDSEGTVKMRIKAP